MKKQKKEAVEEMLEKLKKKWVEALKEASNALLYDSEGPEANRLQGIYKEWINDEFDLIQKFIKALPSCILLTLPVSAKMCFCPCGNKMEKWQKLVNCQFINEDGGCGNNKQGFLTPKRDLLLI